MKGPEPYLADFAPRLDCPVRRGRAARVDSTLRLMVNHDVFFFSDARARDRFRADPIRYAGRLTDPVSRRRFVPTARSPRLERDGRPYVFESEATRSQFGAMPDSFAVRKGM